MPTPAARFVLVIGVLTATLIFGGAGVGIAGAEPDDPGNPANPTDTEPTTAPETAPTVIPAPVPRTLAEQIRDMLHRPLSIFGNGRVPGQPTTVDLDPTNDAKPSSRKSGSYPGSGVRRKPVDPEPTEPVGPKTPDWSSGSAVEVRLPFTPAFSVPLPTVPKTQPLRLSIDLTDPSAARSTVAQTLSTVNSLLADAYAPYNPFPPPKPEPSFRITQEEPVIDADGVNVGGDPFAVAGHNDLPVLQAPMVVPGMAPPVVAPPRGFPEPFRGAGANPEVTGGGSAGAQSPGVRGSGTPTGPVQAEALPGGATPQAGPVVPRQGYTQYLRSAQLGELAAVALPGVVGLLALTASGSVLGYRQAKSARYLRADAVRFVN